jgi:aminoglycoside 6-adenylyltransferase
MRNGTEIINHIVDIATNDNRIRAVLMNGSRANPNIIPDQYQDFDIVFIVRKLSEFTSEHSWVNAFGKIIIRQLPGEMTFGTENQDGFAYLMIFDDGNRIDLTLYPVEKVTNNNWPDSLTVCLLDKDSRFELLPIPNDSGYFIKRPSAKEFSDVCNEFWWVSTYVAKGLLRNEITYAKEMLETVVRPMFMKIIEWKIGVDHRFLVSFGMAGRFLDKYVPGHFKEKVMQTYSDSDIKNNWRALFVMMDLFKETSIEVAGKMNFQVDKTEQENVLRYLRRLYDQSHN